MKRALALYVFLSLSVLGGFNKAQGSSHKSSSSPWQISSPMPKGEGDARCSAEEGGTHHHMQRARATVQLFASSCPPTRAPIPLCMPAQSKLVALLNWGRVLSSRGIGGWVDG